MSEASLAFGACNLFVHYEKSCKDFQIVKPNSLLATGQMKNGPLISIHRSITLKTQKSWENTSFSVEKRVVISTPMKRAKRHRTLHMPNNSFLHFLTNFRLPYGFQEPKEPKKSKKILS